MNILAIETATEACSAAVYRDGAVAERYQLAPREHNRLILPMIGEVLAESGIGLSAVDALAFGRGPGSFTGVRIAAGVAQGIAFARDLPVVPVSTLAALASEALDHEPNAEWAFPCIDARMGEIYWAVYFRGGDRPRLEGAERVMAPSAIDCSMFPALRGVGAGSGWSTYRNLLEQLLGDCRLTVLSDRFPRAAEVARLGAIGFANGEAVPAESALPVYLRDQVARKARALQDATAKAGG